MTGDPHIDELRRFRDSFAARFDNDIEAIGREIERNYATRREQFQKPEHPNGIACPPTAATRSPTA